MCKLLHVLHRLICNRNYIVAGQSTQKLLGWRDVRASVGNCPHLICGFLYICTQLICGFPYASICIKLFPFIFRRNINISCLSMQIHPLALYFSNLVIFGLILYQIVSTEQHIFLCFYLFRFFSFLSYRKSEFKNSFFYPLV